MSPKTGVSTRKADIIDTLQPLFEKARREGLLFQSTVDPSLVFTLDELLYEHLKGHYIWGPQNWKLVHVESLREEIKQKQDTLEKALKKLQTLRREVKL